MAGREGGSEDGVKCLERKVGRRGRLQNFAGMGEKKGEKVKSCGGMEE